MTDEQRGAFDPGYFSALKNADDEYGHISHRDFTVGWQAGQDALRAELVGKIANRISSWPLDHAARIGLHEAISIIRGK